MQDKTIDMLLRVAVAFSFVYPPISAFIQPYAWIGYFPQFMSIIPIEPTLILHAFGAVEIIIAVWIVFGKRIFIPCILAAILLLLIVVFNLNQMDVLFRDISILLSAIALALLHKKERVG